MIYIIGAGPAGCACAYYLSKAGYKSKVFEASKLHWRHVKNN